MTMTPESKQQLTETIKRVMSDFTEEEKEAALMAQAQFLEAYSSVKKAVGLFIKGNPDKKVRLVYEFDASSPSMTLQGIKVD